MKTALSPGIWDKLKIPIPNDIKEEIVIGLKKSKTDIKNKSWSSEIHRLNELRNIWLGHVENNDIFCATHMQRWTHRYFYGVFNRNNSQKDLSIFKKFLGKCEAKFNLEKYVLATQYWPELIENANNNSKKHNKWSPGEGIDYGKFHNENREIFKHVENQGLIVL